ncbi:Fanconi anemia group M protein [Condylostylus longicornis]|uniref:Fanconi anemia group M protein n=1 Tax=Condylostylus longicornis TaxID=2530218 RepID=UPI00244E23B1|nr:Fanconi anemia group M protein [Condylostylus longicornis]
MDNSKNLKNDIYNSTWSSIEDVSVIQALGNSFDSNEGPNNRLRDDENYSGFDSNLGATWVYPINKPIRQYQLSISKNSLFKNTLVVLPTGLGKTFIAAVVMYNIYRWYPNGKIIFMAPTRPLVTQQIDACCKIMGIPKTDIAEMTSKVTRNNRGNEWHNKKIFFATPQIVQRDLSDANIEFPFKHIKLIVVDEAHKAKGKYAYVEVIQSVVEINKNFRVLALTATPGRTITDVLEVIRNLLISNIEIRYENSLDVSPFTHKKNIKIITIPLGKELLSIREELINLIDPYLRALIDDEVISSNVCNMSKGWLIMEQKKFRERSMHQRHINHSKVSLNFSICISLYHALELLERHGTRVLLNYFDEGHSEKEKFFVSLDQNIKKFVEKLRQQTGTNPLLYNDNPIPNGNIPDLPIDSNFGHPKFEYARNILIQHFQEKPESKVIIFCEFRESVMLMHRILHQNCSVIKSKCFVGQGGTGSIRAVTQAQQLKVMKDFREGVCNTLIATSVAEEGIDVGEVDLIICFDISTKNPVRLIQRVGRTGRGRQGQVIMLAAEGKEHLILKEVLANKDKTTLKLLKSREIKEAFYKRSPRLVPPEFDPKCIEVFMKELQSTEKTQNCKQVAKQYKSKSKKTQICFQKKDVRSYFKQVQPDLSQGELAIFDMEQISERDCKSEENTILEIREEIACMSNFYKDYVTTQLDNTEYENEIKNTSAVRELENKFKKLNYMTRQLDKDIKTCDYTKNLDELLKSKVINKSIKRYVLLKNGEYIKEKFNAVNGLLATDEENGSKHTINTSKKKILETYELLESVLGNKMEIEYLIKSYEQEKRKEEMLFNYKAYVTKNVIDSFKSLKKRKPFEMLDTVYKNDFINEDVEKFESIDILNITNETNKNDEKLSITEDTVLPDIDQDFDHSECDSKYASQWNMSNDIKIESHSTSDSKFSNQAQSNSDVIEEVENKKILLNNNFPTVTSTPKLLSKEEKQFSRNPPRPRHINYQEILDNKSTAKNQNQISLHNSNKKAAELKKSILPEKICSEISIDLFDDDFDFVFGENENIDTNTERQYEIKNCEKINSDNFSETAGLKQNILHTKSDSNDENKLDFINNQCEIEGNPVSNTNKCTTLYNTDNIFENFSKEKEFDEKSMISISQILEIVGKKESTVNKLNVTNPELEDFDINDFAEPFEEEENYMFNVDTFENISAEGRNNFKNNIENTENLNNKIYSKQSITSNKNVNVDMKKVTATINGMNDSFIAKNKMCMSPKGNQKRNDVAIDEISPSLIKRTTSRLKLQNACETRYSNSTEKILKKLSWDGFKEDNLGNETQNINSTSQIKPVKKNFKIIFSSDSSDLESSICHNGLQSTNIQISSTPLKEKCNRSRQKLRVKRKTRLKRCNFIDDEAAHSSLNSQESEGNESDAYDSIIAKDDETENFLDSKIYLKYIQTTKSPQILRNNGFKFPSPRQYNDLSKILSQPANDADDILDCNDSFIVGDEEFSESEESEMSPLSKAEAILQKRKREKCKKLLNIQPKNKRRRRILHDIIEISDDEKG